MNKVMAVLLWPVRKLRNLRALVQDEDPGAVLDTHREPEHKTGPDTGGSSSAGLASTGGPEP